jgi:hypothetical protein
MLLGVIMNKLLDWIKFNILRIKPVVHITQHPYWNADTMRKVAGVGEKLDISPIKHIGYLDIDIDTVTKRIIETSRYDDVKKAELLQDWRSDTSIPVSKFEGCTYTGNPILVKPEPCDTCMPSCLDNVVTDVKDLYKVQF